MLRKVVALRFRSLLFSVVNDSTVHMTRVKICSTVNMPLAWSAISSMISSRFCITSSVTGIFKVMML